MNINEFKKKTKTKKASVLAKFKTEILELHNDNYSLNSIVDFLKSNNVNTTFQNVSKFIKNQKDTDIKVQDKEQSKELIETKKEDKKETTSSKFEKVGKDLELKEAPSWAN